MYVEHYNYQNCQTIMTIQNPSSFQPTTTQNHPKPLFQPPKHRLSQRRFPFAFSGGPRSVPPSAGGSPARTRSAAWKPRPGVARSGRRTSKVRRRFSRGFFSPVWRVFGCKGKKVCKQVGHQMFLTSGLEFCSFGWVLVSVSEIDY